MINVKVKTKRIFSSASIVFLVFAQLFPLLVGAATLPTSDSITNTTTGAINKADNQTGSINNKEQSPKVNVAFSANGAMKDGAKITAMATPSSFNNASDPKDLYFTWYIKHAGCDLKDGNVSKCDEDGDGKITENDWKITATKIIIKGDFDKSQANYNVPFDSSLSAYKAMPSPLSDWEIGYGKDANDIDATNCYVQEPKSGVIYELRKVSSILNQCRDIDNVPHKMACIDKIVPTCNILNPEYKTIIDSTVNAFPHLPLPNPMTVNKSILGMVDVCGVKSTSDSDMQCSISDLKNFETTLKCPENSIPMCVPENDSPLPAIDTNNKGTIIKGNIFSKNVLNSTNNVDAEICSSIYNLNQNIDPLLNPPFFENASTPLASFNLANPNKNCNDLGGALVNGTINLDGTTALQGQEKYAPTCSFKKDENYCKHLFPKITNKVSGAYVGDGKFTLAEKEFWGADPTKASTNNTKKDEEITTGLGIDKFVWTYSKGDQVGVVVEGDSDMPTEHLNLSFKRMWAFSNNTCEALEKIDAMDLATDNNSNQNKRGFYFEKNGGVCDPKADSNCSGILTAQIDLNDCLEENLLEPTMDNLYGLKVDLSALPTYPINDVNGGGDILKIVSGSTNVENSENLLYDWSIQKSRDGSSAPLDATNWQDITAALIAGGSIVDTDLVGLGKKEFSINLNMQENVIGSGMNAGTYKEGDPFWLRVKVKITGGAVDGGQNAQGIIDVRVIQQQNEIRRYPILAKNDGSLTLNMSNSPICGDQEGKAVCYVTKNEIIGVIVPKNAKSGESKFNWFVNGNEIACKAASQCSDGNVLFFPIIGNVGESVDVTAKGQDKNGEAIEISRHFVIVEPQITIKSLDENSAWSKLLGYYKDVNGNKYPDYSTQVMETNSGKVATLGAAVYPAWKAGQAGFDWAIDGQVIPEFANQDQIKLSIEKFPGESYNVGLVANIIPGSADQINNIRLSLVKYWGIAIEDIVEEKSNANIQLNVVEGSLDAVAAAKQNFFGASLITHIPEQLMFLLKISLTSLALFFLTGLLFSIIPERIFAKEK